VFFPTCKPWKAPCLRPHLSSVNTPLGHSAPWFGYLVSKGFLFLSSPPPSLPFPFFPFPCPLFPSLSLPSPLPFPSLPFLHLFRQSLAK
jgi:hypothetical protein